MNEDQPKSTAKQSEHEAPKGASVDQSLKIGKRILEYRAEAEWILLRKKEKPRAEMFSVSYLLKNGGQRPLTFVFNGGPGASSAFLHLGALGPKRVDFQDDGMPKPPPSSLEDNRESWLQFTDLVFVDPIGTGFSRMIEDDDKDGEKAKVTSGDKEGSEYWKVKRDLESLAEFICKYLSRYDRWESPVYIAGESYGGFRTAKLTKLLQNDYGVGLNGAVIISPALEFYLLDGSDYDALHWVDVFPSMAGAAFIHGKSRNIDDGESLEDFLARAERFAVRELLPILAAGSLFGEHGVEETLGEAAEFLGIPRDVVKAKNGRVDIPYFVKNLLRDQGKHLGLYDAALAVTDPFPDRDGYGGPDPTLHHTSRVFTAGINTQLRKTIGLETDRDYDLLSMEVNKSWKVDTRDHELDSQVGSTDDLRYGMSINPDMKVYICHGYFDLITPFFAADRISALMKLTDDQREKLTLRHFFGGHMFYTRRESRELFFADMKAFYES